MKVTYKNSLKYKVLKRLSRLNRTVVLRADFADLGGYRQVGQALTALIQQKRLVRMGYGVYAKAFPSQYDKRTIIIEGGADKAFREALNRLAVKWEPGTAEQAYNAGLSTQVPAYNIVKLKSRCRRELSYRGQRIRFEGAVNAK